MEMSIIIIIHLSVYTNIVLSLRTPAHRCGGTGGGARGPNLLLLPGQLERLGGSLQRVTRFGDDRFGGGGGGNYKDSELS